MNDIQKDICNLVSHMMSQNICTLVYRDRDGVTSVRYIRVLGIQKADNGHHFVRAYDTQRNAPRSFRIAAISAVYAGTPWLAMQPHEAEAQAHPEAYVPQTGDRVRFHYTKWPKNCTPIEFSGAFVWNEHGDGNTIAATMRDREDGWEFIIEKADD